MPKLRRTRETPAPHYHQGRLPTPLPGSGHRRAARRDATWCREIASDLSRRRQPSNRPFLPDRWRPARRSRAVIRLPQGIAPQNPSEALHRKGASEGRFFEREALSELRLSSTRPQSIPATRDDKVQETPAGVPAPSPTGHPWWRGVTIPALTPVAVSRILVLAPIGAPQSAGPHVAPLDGALSGLLKPRVIRHGRQWVAVVIEGALVVVRSREGRRPLHAAGELVARYSYAFFAGIIPIRKNAAPSVRPPHFTKMYSPSEVLVRFGAQLGAIIAKSRSALS